MLLLLATIWGASFMLIEIGLRDLEPGTLIFVRLASAAVALALAVPFLVGTRAALAQLGRSLWPLAVLGLLNTAVPFVLIAWGQQYIDSGIAAILNASAPLFTVLLALSIDRRERVTGMRLAGFLVGFGGVALVVGGEPGSGTKALLGSLAVVVSALFYAFGALYAGKRTSHLQPAVLSLGVLLFATAFSLPVALAELPSETPGAGPLSAVLALGVVATAFAFLLYYGLIAGAGASRAILVTYLVPALAVVYGVTLLDESLTVVGVAGLALVLLGVALGTGTLRAGRRVAPAGGSLGR
jgi:drug/metabolite transporter (DMT)-like permease